MLNKRRTGKGGSPPYTLSWSDGVVSGTNGQIMTTLIMD
jgi:hypothetical protein